MVHELQMKENRVFDRPVEVVFEDEAYLAVNKPASIPVHPCGAFHFNSLSMILQFEMGYKNLLSIICA